MSQIYEFAAAAFCIVRDSKLLLVRNREKHAFYLPGGKIEQGETIEHAVCRELKEELSITLDPSSLTLYETCTAQAYGEPDGVTVRLLCYMGTYTGTIQAASEIEEVRFFTYEMYTAMSETAPAVVMLMRQLQTDSLMW